VSFGPTFLKDVIGGMKNSSQSLDHLSHLDLSHRQTMRLSSILAVEEISTNLTYINICFSRIFMPPSKFSYIFFSSSSSS
jgi:hypothetical protein